ncbi:hypothetical protein EFV37_05700 [Mesorhizobium loti]|uniref:Uncharacterized protein n=1 Tax=Mesorhizobium jarvisii TaxID=1777867 RepID=A0A6M7TAT3_9HYPH|nr:hypothetical protein EB229_05700 [Mesorhizobium jarvisii]QKD07762.1 hypothetical protein EFV37_05700 [Mesorhizobium loti]RJT35541.1 hypothetical protein D3242_08680 [Mesorhizobium jarvisii]
MALRTRRSSPTDGSGVGAAPHPPAGTFSPYRDGEKGTARDLGTFRATSVVGESSDESAPLPVSIRGEDAGRQVRGGADIQSQPKAGDIL